MSRLLALFVLMGASHTMRAQAGTPREPYSARQALKDRLVVIEQQVVPAAEVMPESEYGYAPHGGAFAGVRTFAE